MTPATEPANAVLLQQLRQSMHDLSQPLSALQCRLELGKMIGDEEALREAVMGGLEDMQRVVACAHALHACLRGGGENGASC